jgi:hypothetical protein
LINQVVIALNEGKSLSSIVLSVPTVEGKLDLRGIDFSHKNLHGPWVKRGDMRFRIGVNLRNVDFDYLAYEKE